MINLTITQSPSSVREGYLAYKVTFTDAEGSTFTFVKDLTDKLPPGSSEEDALPVIVSGHRWG